VVRDGAKHPEAAGRARRVGARARRVGTRGERVRDNEIEQGGPPKEPAARVTARVALQPAVRVIARAAPQRDVRVTARVAPQRDVRVTARVALQRDVRVIARVGPLPADPITRARPKQLVAVGLLVLGLPVLSRPALVRPADRERAPPLPQAPLVAGIARRVVPRPRPQVRAVGRQPAWPTAANSGENR
jgi:hypothetical protein